MQIRRATVADAEAIERIRVRSWQAAYRHVFPPKALEAMPVEWSRWEDDLPVSTAGLLCVVAEDERGLLGWATYGPSGLDQYGELRGLYVDPDRWGEGAGRSLLAHAELELATTWNEAILFTLEDNPRTRRLYEAAGWRTDGVTGSFTAHGVDAPVVRYAKRLTSSASRS
jgi:GNAT superfamily N-acetyltransferase